MGESSPLAADHPRPEDIAVINGVVNGVLLARAVSAVSDLGVADALGEGPQAAAELAVKIGAHPDILGRVLRFVAAYGVFEGAGGLYRHNGASRLLRRDHPASLAPFMAMMTDAWPILQEFDYMLRTGRPAVEKASGGSYWSYLAAHPEEAERFNRGMTSKAAAQIAGLMAVYDFSPFTSIADVGGGRGHFIEAILAAHPQASGVLFELPQVIGALGAPGHPRLAHQAGDFFHDALPDCDALLMMNVIHDWNDAEADAILRNARRSARPGAKLLVAEAPLPETDGPHPNLMSDIFMMVLATGRERKTSEYEALLAASGWRLDRVAEAPNGMAMFEAAQA